MLNVVFLSLDGAAEAGAVRVETDQLPVRGDGELTRSDSDLTPRKVKYRHSFVKRLVWGTLHTIALVKGRHF